MQLNTFEAIDPFINGEWTQTEQSFEVVNPATGRTLAFVGDASAETMQSAVSAAYEAFGAWSTRTGKERGNVLRRMADALDRNLEGVARVMTAEQGKPLTESRGELQGCVEFLEWYAEEAKRQYGSVIGGYTSAKRQVVIHQPVGVVAAITPWNFPAMMIVRKAASALAAGCTVVAKPAEQTPLTALALAHVFQDEVPAGVINVVPTSNPGTVGLALVEDPLVSHVTFTGSTEVGRRIGSIATQHLKRISLELGGHAPFLVFDDSDIELAASELRTTKFKNAGQTCVCPNRILVQEGVADSFVEALAERVSVIRVGPGDEADVDMGPLIDPAALAKVEAHLADASQKGARIVVGGERPGGPGYFFEPTILTDTTPDMRLMAEETFGPVAPITTFATEDEAIEQANALPFGLTAYAYTDDLNRAIRLAERLAYGLVGINDNRPGSVQTPFGGWKESGIGREGGREGLEEFLETKTISIGIHR